jgi:hypothetical protein
MHYIQNIFSLSLLDKERFVANVTDILVAALGQERVIDMLLKLGGLQRIGQLKLWRREAV